jgi:membrane-bound lytic murein transglycosylase B
LRRLCWSPAALLAAAFVALALGPVPAAHAESAASARAAAERAAAQVSALAPQVQTALLAYQRALDDLAQGVQRNVRAEERADAAALVAARAHRDQGARVRALYMSGGTMGLVASILDSGSPADVADRMVSVRRVVSAGRSAVATTAVRSTGLRVTAGRLKQAVQVHVTTAAEVEVRYAELQAVLDQAGARLSTLSARAKGLAEAEAAAARLRALAAAAAASGARSLSRAHPIGMPPEYRRLYLAAAATCRGLPWKVLAAIGQVESGHGRNVGPSSSGAMGPMQFLPGTFDHYAVDGDRDGDTDILDPADAIFTAAHYLCANKGGTGPVGLHFAIFRYNHAEWYVQLVLRLAALIT